MAIVSLGVGLLWAGEKYGHIEDQMEKVHKGKRSPLKQTQEQLAKESPTWDVVDKQLPAFKAMSQALKDSKNSAITDAADGYTTAIDDLVAAVKKQDVTAARTALKNLTNSCADCHYKGGPGGKLEHSGEGGHHEHEHHGRHHDD
ncbi:MAG: hypothetical protein K8T25_20800 [Planctomycetia bacterium]|nr:hypothetical protein [Planctomycetia bacterium]